MARRATRSRWRLCDSCGRERRLDRNGAVMCEHNRWDPVGRAMVPCEGSGRKPAPQPAMPGLSYHRDTVSGAEGRLMAFRKVSYLIPACDGCGLAWSFLDPVCTDGIPPHFAERAAALELLHRDYGWQIRARRFGRPLMACRTCAAAGVIPAGEFRGLLLAAAGWVRRWVPFGPVLRPLPPSPGPGHPESLTAELPPEDEDLLAAIEDENFPES